MSALGEVLAARREMAEVLEEMLQGCGNQVPGRPESHAADCEDCRPEREAILRWARANGRLHLASRGALTELQRALTRARGHLERGRSEAAVAALDSAIGHGEELARVLGDRRGGA